MDVKVSWKFRVVYVVIGNVPFVCTVRWSFYIRKILLLRQLSLNHSVVYIYFIGYRSKRRTIYKEELLLEFFFYSKQ
jgi:hypothetical protein